MLRFSFSVAGIQAALGEVLPDFSIRIESGSFILVAFCVCPKGYTGGSAGQTGCTCRSWAALAVGCSLMECCLPVCT